MQKRKPDDELKQEMSWNKTVAFCEELNKFCVNNSTKKMTSKKM